MIKEVNVITGVITSRELTAEEIAAEQAWQAADKAVFDALPYDVKRKRELEVLDGEGLDAIRKEIEALRNGDPETPEYAAYKAKVDTVKTKYPK